jgi:hypothetical protein
MNQEGHKDGRNSFIVILGEFKKRFPDQRLLVWCGCWTSILNDYVIEFLKFILRGLYGEGSEGCLPTSEF